MTPDAARRADGQVAVVTGAASGIGAATAQRLVDDGLFVVAADLREARVAAEHHRWRWVPCDVAVEADVAMVVAAAEAARTLSVLVSCAGVTTKLPIDDTTEGAWRRVLEVNLEGTPSPSSIACR